MIRAEWLEWRRHGLGGSDLGQIPSVVRAVGGDPDVDCSPWGGEWHVWASKLEAPRERVMGADVDTGRLLERAVIDWALGTLGAVEHDEEAVPDLERRHLRGTPDCIAHSPDGRIGIEAKVSADYPWEAPPLYYRLQCAAYMALTGLDRWYLACFFRRAPAWKLYPLDRDPVFEAAMLEAVEAWWERHVVRGEHPQLDDSGDCSRALGRLHPRTAGTTAADFRVATDAEIEAATEAYRLGQIGAEIERDRRRLENQIRGSIGDAAGLRWTGGSVRWSRQKLTIKLENDR